MKTLLPKMIRRSIDPLDTFLLDPLSDMTEERARSGFEACDLLAAGVERLRANMKSWLSAGAVADTARYFTGEVADTSRALLWAMGELLSRCNTLPDFPGRDEGIKSVERLKGLAAAMHAEAVDVLRRLDAVKPLRPAPGLLDALQAQGAEKFTRFEGAKPGQETAS